MQLVNSNPLQVCPSPHISPHLSPQEPSLSEKLQQAQLTYVLQQIDQQAELQHAQLTLCKLQIAELTKLTSTKATQCSDQDISS